MVRGRRPNARSRNESVLGRSWRMARRLRMEPRNACGRNRFAEPSDGLRELNQPYCSSCRSAALMKASARRCAHDGSQTGGTIACEIRFRFNEFFDNIRGSFTEPTRSGLMSTVVQRRAIPQVPRMHSFALSIVPIK